MSEGYSEDLPPKMVQLTSTCLDYHSQAAWSHLLAPERSPGFVPDGELLKTSNSFSHFKHEFPHAGSANIRC